MRISEKALNIIKKMSLEEKVGQLFIVRCPREDAAEDVKKYHLGGYTLYAVDFEGKTPEDVRSDIQSYQNNADIPLFIAADEEGGKVVRISIFSQFRSEPFISPSELYREGGIKRIADDAKEKSEFLLGYGINLNYAPVCDMATNPDNFIYHRTLGLDAEKTAEYAQTVVKVMNECKMLSAVKHFPGYGDNVDTHTSVARDGRSMEEFMSGDLLPFIRAFEVGAPVVMIAHNIVKCMDPSCPASLSPKVHRFLREDLHFDNVIMTDSLDMNAITLYTGDRAAAVQAIISGNDLLCCGTYKIQIPAVIDAVKKGEISEERIDDSLGKILQLKIDFGIIE